jgi:hypothetical protein
MAHILPPAMKEQGFGLENLGLDFASLTNPNIRSSTAVGMGSRTLPCATS